MAEGESIYECFQNFQFPLQFDPKKFNLQEKICVVSIFGKSNNNFSDAKLTCLHNLLKRPIVELPNGAMDDPYKNQIMAYYDWNLKVMYLKLNSSLEQDKIKTIFEISEKKLSFIKVLENYEYEFSKSVLWLLSVSHILILSNSSSMFDMSYVRMFRLIDSLRRKLGSYVTDILSTSNLNISKEWANAGRLCSPRVLFAFERCSIDQSNWDINKARHKVPPLTRLEHKMEDNIYSLLRKSRVVSDITSNSLFAVPNNQEFVYIHEYGVDNCHLLGLANRKPINGTHSYKRDKPVVTTKYPSQVSSFHSDQDKSIHKSLVEFVKEHIEVALKGGFQDNSRKYQGSNYFELPTISNWLEISQLLYDIYVNEKLPERQQIWFDSELKRQLSMCSSFSRSNCENVYPKAKSIYKENLPKYFTRIKHETRLNAAIEHLRTHCRGPELENFIERLIKESTIKWENERRQCESISLNGRPCIKKAHRTSFEEITIENKIWPIDDKHSNEAHTISFCNCGSICAEKSDPFDVKFANKTFYDELEKNCCHNLVHVTLPVFQPSINEPKAFTLLKNEDNAEQMVALSESDLLATYNTDLSQPPILSKLEGTTQANSAGSQQNIEQSKNSADFADKNDKLSDFFKSLQISKSAERQNSTTEYLNGMLHTKSPNGLLPLFSSFSLLKIANYNWYDPSTGIKQVNFIQNNFLCYWDVHVGRTNEQTKSNAWKGIHRDMDVKVYLGNEYECALGHRFFAHLPDKLYKASSPGKDNARKILSTDMPLYFPCPCKTEDSGNIAVAQLMRIWVAVPNAPISVTLDPQIRPGPEGETPIFVLSRDGPINLAVDSVWILRLPHFYNSNGINYLFSSKTMNACKILKGTFNIVNHQ